MRIYYDVKLTNGKVLVFRQAISFKFAVWVRIV